MVVPPSFRSHGHHRVEHRASHPPGRFRPNSASFRHSLSLPSSLLRRGGSGLLGLLGEYNGLSFPALRHSPRPQPQVPPPPQPRAPRQRHRPGPRPPQRPEAEPDHLERGAFIGLHALPLGHLNCPRPPLLAKSARQFGTISPTKPQRTPSERGSCKAKDNGISSDVGAVLFLKKVWPEEPEDDDDFEYILMSHPSKYRYHKDDETPAIEEWWNDSPSPLQRFLPEISSHVASISVISSELWWGA